MAKILFSTLTVKGEDEQVQEVTKEMKSGRPQSFVFEDLSPDTSYVAMFPALATKATFKTKKESEDMKSFKLIALSCDKPARLLLGQLNPWKNVLRTVNSGKVDVILHLGDQIYPDGKLYYLVFQFLIQTLLSFYF